MTVDQFTRQMEDFGQELSALDDLLLAIGGEVINNLRAQAPVDSGRLRQSIQAVVAENELNIAMLAYGMFQNYGVDGMQQSRATAVPFGINPQPTAGGRYGFSGQYEMIGGDLPIPVKKSIYAFGLRPQNWFNLETVTEYIETELARRLVETI